MKKIILPLLMVFCTIGAYSQSDSLAVATINDQGVYYYENGGYKKIEPITYSGIKAGGFMSVKAKMLYDGENSKNIIYGRVFYVFIPSIMKAAYNVNNFKLVQLEAKNGNRRLTTVSAVPFSAKVGANSESLSAQWISEELIKVTIGALQAGHYGIFYDYAGGTPYKLYDFDIK